MANTKRIRNVAEFIATIEGTYRKDEVVFRGQPAAELLLPRIARNSFRARNVLRDDEREMLEHFRSRAVPFLNVIPENDWEWLALAQHHGMATRLLDWTQNPLAALWFAVHAPAHRSRDGNVVFFEVSAADRHVSYDALSPFAIQRTYVVRPRHIAPRITRQAGWFTVHHTTGRKSSFSALDDDEAFRNRLKRVRVPREYFADIRSTLDRCGVNRASLMPDLSGLAMHLEWLHSRLKDEQPHHRRHRKKPRRA
jgi:hypothetical protein